jgi:EAL domain-containing protein (putative c-di-GMP-specific phosphodiesterase class I)
LASIGVDRQQGYLYSRPIPAEEFARILVPIR